MIVAEDTFEPDLRCEYARAALLSAREGLALIRSTEPHSYLALFLVLGLVTNTRHIWHALTNRDRSNPAWRTRIDAWKNEQPPEMKRRRELLQAARDLLIKEWKSTPIVASGTRHYGISMYLPRTESRDDCLTEEEIADRQQAARFASVVGADESKIMNSVRIDVLAECEAALAMWEREILKVEGPAA